jgi:hypothetical protein
MAEPAPDERQGAALDWINERWDKWGQKCEMCHSTDWAVGSLLGFPVRSEIGMLDLSQRVFPAYPVTCTTCGNTHLLSAIVAGIVEQAQET